MLMLTIQFGTVFMATYFVVARARPASLKRFVSAALLGAALLLAVGLPFVMRAPIYGGIVLVLAGIAIPMLPAGDALRAGFLQKRQFSLLFVLWSIPLLALATFLMIRLPTGKLSLEQMRALLPLSAVSLAAIPVAMYYDLREWRSASVGRRAWSAFYTLLLLFLFVGSAVQVYWELRRLF